MPSNFSDSSLEKFHNQITVPATKFKERVARHLWNLKKLSFEMFSMFVVEILQSEKYPGA